MLLALYFGWSGRVAPGRDPHRAAPPRQEETVSDYRALGVLVIIKLLESLLYLSLSRHILPLNLSAQAVRLIYATSYWTLYILSTICVFFVMGAILRSSLQPLHGLASAALVIFRWAAILALFIALAAHIPIFGVPNLFHWLDEVSVSFMLCVCSFEISLLVVITMQLGRLGMYLRSRPVGVAIGLTMLGCMDLLSAVTVNLPPRTAELVGSVVESVILLALLIWIVYIVLPEPRRMAPALSPASKLMRWNEIALRLGGNSRPTETVPFISAVEAQVDEILAKHNIGNIGKS